MNQQIKALLLGSAAAATLAISLGISGTFLAVQISGDDALRHKMNDHLATASEKIGVLERQAHRGQDQIGALNQIQTRLRNYISCEISVGCLSGSPGDGPFTEGLRGFLGPLNDVQASASTAVDDMQGDLIAARSAVDRGARAAREGDRATFVEVMNIADSSIAQAQGRATAALFEGNPLRGSGISQIDALGQQLANLQRLELVEGLTRPLPQYVDIDASEAVSVMSDRIFLTWVLVFAIEAIPAALVLITLMHGFFHGRNDEGDDPSGFDQLHDEALAVPMRPRSANAVPGE